MEAIQELAGIKVEIARHDERIEDTEKWRDKQNGTLKEIQNELKQMREDFSRELQKLGTRPTWGVTIVITFLTSLVGIMATFIFSNLPKL